MKKDKSDEQDFEREHPSYGMLDISRTNGSSAVRLFGSPLADHYSTIRIRVSKARWHHHLDRDWFHGMSKDHIEIELSAAQFADAITSLNHGAGTPCTIRYIDGKRVEDPPDYATEAEHVRQGFGETLKSYIAKAREQRKRIEELTGKLGEKARREIRIALDVMEDQLASNVPFVVRQFEQATSKITSAAKAEVDAFVTGVFRAAGIEAIAQGRFGSLLPEPKAPQLAKGMPDIGQCPTCNKIGECEEHDYAGRCPACGEEGDCLSQCPSAGNPRTLEYAVIAPHVKDG